MTILSLSALALSTQTLAGDSRHFDDGFYVEAEVVRVEPIVRMVRVAEPREVCWERRIRHRGRHRWHHHYQWRHRRPGRRHAAHEHVCEVRTEYHDERRIDGYTVTYRYKGRRFTTRSDRDPGNRIRLRLRVEPASEYETLSASGKDRHRRGLNCGEDCFDS